MIETIGKVCVPLPENAIGAVAILTILGSSGFRFGKAQVRRAWERGDDGSSGMFVAVAVFPVPVIWLF